MCIRKGNCFFRFILQKQFGRQFNSVIPQKYHIFYHLSGKNVSSTFISPSMISSGLVRVPALLLYLKLNRKKKRKDYFLFAVISEFLEIFIHSFFYFKQPQNEVHFKSDLFSVDFSTKLHKHPFEKSCLKSYKLKFESKFL